VIVLWLVWVAVALGADSGPLDSWRFAVGDDPEWADPSFDDSAWEAVDPAQAWPDGASVTWARTEIVAEPTDDTVVVVQWIRDSWELYIDGVRVCGEGSLPPEPAFGPLWPVATVCPVGAALDDGRAVLALRTWGSPHGKPGWRVWPNYGPSHDVGLGLDDWWFHKGRAPFMEVAIAVVVLFAGLLHLQLWWRRRERSEYLWFGLATVSFGLSVVVEMGNNATGVFDYWPHLARTPQLLKALAVSGITVFVFRILDRTMPVWMKGLVAVVLALATALVASVYYEPVYAFVSKAWLLGVVAGALSLVGFVVVDAWRGNADARTLALGLLTLFACGVFDATSSLFDLRFQATAQYGFLFAAGSMALTLSNRFARAYADLDALNAELELKVATRNAELEERGAELQERNAEIEARNTELLATQTHLVQAEKMAALGTVVAGVAHELRDPVNFMATGVVPLRRDAAKVLSRIPAEALDRKGQRVVQRVDKLLDAVENGAGRIVAIVESLRSFSRQDDADAVEADLHEGLDATLVLLEGRRKGAEVEVTRDYADLPRVRCHATQLEQVWMNLLVNAIQASESGDTITVSTRRDAQYVTVAIADTGCGIPEELRERIFDPFFTTKDVGEGTGLGLSILHGIVRNHAGTITVESEVGEGTAFTVRLPIDPKSGNEDPA
jgi:signal transduction histidine kinase